MKSQYKWTPKRRLHYHRLKRFVGWRKGKNAGKTWADFLEWEMQHPNGVTLESMIKGEEARRRLVEKFWPEIWAEEEKINEEKLLIASLRRELIKSINRKDWEPEEKRKAIGVVNMTPNRWFKEQNFLT